MIDFYCPAVTTNLRGGEGGGKVVAGEGTDIRFFGGSPSDEPDRASIAEKGVGRGNAPDTKFGDKIGGDEEFFFFQAGGIGEEGCGVAVLSDPEDDEVEAGRVADLGMDPFLIFPCPDFGGTDFGADSFDLHSCTLEDFLDHAEVTVFMIGIDPAFVA